MKLRTIAIVLTVALASAAAHAQSGVYVTFNAQQFTQEGVDTSGPPEQQNIDRPWLFGPGYGVYYDVTHLPYLGKLKTGPVVFGIDAPRRNPPRLRIRFTSSTARTASSASASPPRTTVKGITPYIQGGFGIGHTRFRSGPAYSNNFIYQFGRRRRPARSTRHIDWRIVEATAGFLGSYNRLLSAGHGPQPEQLHGDAGHGPCLPYPLVSAQRPQTGPAAALAGFLPGTHRAILPRAALSGILASHAHPSHATPARGWSVPASPPHRNALAWSECA